VDLKQDPSGCCLPYQRTQIVYQIALTLAFAACLQPYFVPALQRQAKYVPYCLGEVSCCSTSLLKCPGLNVHIAETTSKNTTTYALGTYCCNESNANNLALCASIAYQEAELHRACLQILSSSSPHCHLGTGLLPQALMMRAQPGCPASSASPQLSGQQLPRQLLVWAMHALSVQLSQLLPVQALQLLPDQVQMLLSALLGQLWSD